MDLFSTSLEMSAHIYADVREYIGMRFLESQLENAKLIRKLSARFLQIADGERAGTFPLPLST
jgi:hypothetical protein